MSLAAAPRPPATPPFTSSAATSPASPIGLRTVALTRDYGADRTQVRALDRLDLELDAGGFTAIMGPSGSGKSTLLHCLAGLDRPTSGQVFLGATELGALSDRELTRVRRDRIGFVFQSFNLLPTLTARANITLPLDLAGRRPDPVLLGEVIDELGLADRLDHRPSELSGGQQQRVAIARALVTRPDVVFADEPTGALDSMTGQTLLNQLRRASREQGQTIVMVTHDPSAAAYADRVVLLSDGRLVDDLDRPDPESVLLALTSLGR